MISVLFGALAGAVGYLAWLLELSNYTWWPWAFVGGLVGLAVGLVASWPEKFFGSR